MEREKYIKHIKKLLKTYHPDLCHDENLRDTYNEITIKLNRTLENLEDDKITKSNENILENKSFNIFSFRYYLSKIQSIGISKNSISNKDYIIFRDFLVSEINKNDKKIGEYFSLLLSDKNIMNESINLFANAYANYNSIFQNYYQYNEQTVKQCIRIGDSYFNDYIRKCEIKEINEIIDEIKKWFQEIMSEIYNQRYCT
jgi:hypothetical protein